MKPTHQSNPLKFLRAIIACATLVTWSNCQTAVLGQEVSARISTREAYIGMPITFEIRVANARHYELPELFEIDGCEVRSGGAPSKRSQIMIHNGRRSETSSVTMRYFITAMREGKFQIPDLVVHVEGKQQRIKAPTFVATKSETGDLMFVEIAGEKNKVYVGEPLDLNLKIWLRPFQDREKRITLNEDQMWQMMSEQTSWGQFRDRMQEMANDRRRPGGKEVLRADSEGNERGYFLYEIKATIYPDRPGKIDGSDVKIVANYPVSLGKSRGSFGSVFGNSRLGGNSLINQMMQDDFFGDSGFGRSLSVTEARPIVGLATVDATEVLPVPAKDQPADYRGAVGQYNIVSDAEPRILQAGDPITLKVGVVGDGPMKLVQAPPLDSIPSLTTDFKVSDKALAGFVQDQSKVFVTTIRPKHSGITKVPAIPFSFFDPEKEKYVTVYSQPISIEVTEADSLSLDLIVSNAADGESINDADDAGDSDRLLPDFSNDDSDSLLASQNLPAKFPWKYFIIVPPIVWGVFAIFKLVGVLFGQMPSFRSSKSRALSEVMSAESVEALAVAVTQFIGEQTENRPVSPQQAVGALRLLGLNNESNRVESFLNLMQSPGASNAVFENLSLLEVYRQEAIGFVESLDSNIANSEGTHLRRRDRSRHLVGKGTIAGLLVAMIVCNPANAESEIEETKTRCQQQLQTILDDANQSYGQAMKSKTTDAALAKELFARSAAKYQMLNDLGHHNSRVYTLIGNAQLQSGRFGNAIASYRRALIHDPFDKQAERNLKFAQNKLQLDASPSNGTGGFGSSSGLGLVMSNANQWMTKYIGLFTIQILAALASVCFWLLIIFRTLGKKSLWESSVLGLAILPLLVLILAGASLWLTDRSNETRIAIAVVGQLELKDGDGQEFSTVSTLEKSEGQEFNVLDRRNGWVKLSSADERSGWVHVSKVEVINPSE